MLRWMVGFTPELTGSNAYLSILETMTVDKRKVVEDAVNKGMELPDELLDQIATKANEIRSQNREILSMRDTKTAEFDEAITNLDQQIRGFAGLNMLGLGNLLKDNTETRSDQETIADLESKRVTATSDRQEVVNIIEKSISDNEKVLDDLFVQTGDTLFEAANNFNKGLAAGREQAAANAWSQFKPSDTGADGNGGADGTGEASKPEVDPGAPGVLQERPVPTQATQVVGTTSTNKQTTQSNQGTTQSQQYDQTISQMVSQNIITAQQGAVLHAVVQPDFASNAQKFKGLDQSVSQLTSILNALLTLPSSDVSQATGDKIKGLLSNVQNALSNPAELLKSFKPPDMTGCLANTHTYQLSNGLVMDETGAIDNSGCVIDPPFLSLMSMSMKLGSAVATALGPGGKMFKAGSAVLIQPLLRQALNALDKEDIDMMESKKNQNGLPKKRHCTMPTS